MIATTIFQRMAQAVFAVVVLTTAVRAQETLTVPAEMVQFPDLIVHNAKIVTMDDTSPTGPPGSIFQAMAIREDRIQFLGSNAQVLRYAGPRTRFLQRKMRSDQWVKKKQPTKTGVSATRTAPGSICAIGLSGRISTPSIQPRGFRGTTWSGASAAISK